VTAGDAPATLRKIGVKGAVTAVRRPLAARRFRAAVAGRRGPLKIEVGSSRTVRPGWLPTDIGWRARYWLDVTKPWGVPPGSVGHVYADNVIEHLTLEGTRSFLRHAHRALRPGGRIRLVSPDAERYARMYLDGGPLLAAHVDRSRRHGYRVDHDVCVLRAVFVECGHHEGYVWDLEALRSELDAAGFVDVERREVGSSDDPALRDLESRTEPSDRLLQLVVEAVRP
jgi:predicted SAM-dependent methyltransferase